jgi:plasmid replication initiation protein
MKKDTNLVVYDNYLNQLSFKEFTDYDLSFFMVICERMRDLGEELQTFDYDMLMDLLEWDKTKSIDVFHKDLQRMCERLRHVGATIEIDPDNFTAFNLFSTFEGHKKTRKLDVQVNPRFKHILNKLSGNFTEFELAEYIRLDGKYAKLLYQHLKQYRRTGWWQVSVDDIRRELAIPDSMPTRNILPKTINPSIELIKKCRGFGELEVEVIKSPRRGRKVEGYKFKWTADKQIKGQMSLDDYMRHNKPTKKKKNSFNNFEQNTYDFEELEKQLLDN